MSGDRDALERTAHAPVLLDVAGTRLDAADRRRLAHPLTGGIVLFARNWRDRRRLVELVAEVKDVRPDLLVAVDHEGGRVQRFRDDGFTPLAPMRALGEAWQHDDGAPGGGEADDRARGTGAMRALESATAVGFVIGSELRACGVDLSFAPVLDLDHGPSGVIGDRAFHRDPRVVALLARGVMHGLAEAGMRNCGKHFPGHGWVAADSHTEVPVDERTLDAILGDDARPYEWLAGVLAGVMPAHVVYPRVDHRPAGFSARWLKDVLRTRMAFEGAIFSDDLAMAGARRVDGVEVGMVDAACMALDAGCDLVLVCNQSAHGRLLDDFLDDLARAADEGRWQRDPSSEARRLDLLPTSAPLAWDELMHLPAYQRALERLP